MFITSTVSLKSNNKYELTPVETLCSFEEPRNVVFQHCECHVDLLEDTNNRVVLLDVFFSHLHRVLGVEPPEII